MVVGTVLGQLLVVALLLGGGYLVVRNARDSAESDPAIEELRAAYARGDLSDEEYDRRYERLERE